MRHDLGPGPMPVATDKLRLLQSPLVVDKHSLRSDVSSLGHQPESGLEDRGYRRPADDEYPHFRRHVEATNSEVFFDLFFAANLTVFSDTHDITDIKVLSGYIAYFCVLWLTWALIGLYDVRYVTDSIFERITRGCHLGVMVGIAVVAPLFDPTKQVRSTFRVMSIVLLVSRVVLACQYGSIIWLVRNYRMTRLPLALMVGINVVSAIIYLGIVFGFKDHNTYVYVSWYVVSIVEIIATVALSLKWKVLSFKGTHLINRMAMLTFIMIGEGVIVVATGVGKIVVTADSWTPSTVGNVVAGIGNLYIIYMIYFDFMREINLPSYRQLSWSLLHFPFHLAMNIFVQGSSQFVVWWKIMEILKDINQKFYKAVNVADEPSFQVRNITEWFATTLNTTTQELFALYPPKYYDTWRDVDDAVGQILTVDNDWWNTTGPGDENDPTFQFVTENIYTLMNSIENSLFASFKINGLENVKNATELDIATFEEQASNANWGRFYLVFSYAFITAGLTLMLMNCLLIASRTKRWTAWNHVRVALNFLVGLGLCLLSLIQLNEDHAAAFQESPWILPSLLLTFFVVLVLNHLPHPPPALFGGKRGKKKKKKRRAVGAEERGSAAVATTAGEGATQVSSWDVVGHMGFRDKAAHEKIDPAVSSVPAQGAGYETRRQSGTGAETGL